MVDSVEPFIAKIAQELRLESAIVKKLLNLLDSGETIPYIVRHRHDLVGSIKRDTLYQLLEHLQAVYQLSARRKAMLSELREEDRLTAALEKAIQSASSKTELEDLYLPFRQKRRTKALSAKKLGLDTLAMAIIDDPNLEPRTRAGRFINPEKGVATVEAALEGARQVLLEYFSEDAALLKALRQYIWQHAALIVHHSPNEKGRNTRIKQYTNGELVCQIPGHKALALMKGRREETLQLSLDVPNNASFGEQRLATYFSIQQTQRPADLWLMAIVGEAWKSKVYPKLESEVFSRLRERAFESTQRMYAMTYRRRLMAAPAGERVIMGVNSGGRSGVGIAIIDANGQHLDAVTLFPFSTYADRHDAIISLAKLVVTYDVDMIALGDTASAREMDQVLRDLFAMYPDFTLSKVWVNSDGVSTYASSSLANNELSALTSLLRAAVSIARRLQNPLAELAKLSPSALTLGAEQQDMNKKRLNQYLTHVLIDCVNEVGVKLNTAPVSLLKYVSGLDETVAQAVVQHREAHGAFSSRAQLRQAQLLDDKTFEQAASFLIFPQADPSFDETSNLPSDPRPKFKSPARKEGVENLSQLQKDMVLEGRVSQITHFGVFVDVGVHHDGLVHLSEMGHRFVSDPHTVVQSGEVVTVKVLQCDVNRNRLDLTMKSTTPGDSPTRRKPAQPSSKQKKSASVKKSVFNTAMADALSKLKTCPQGSR